MDADGTVVCLFQGGWGEQCDVGGNGNNDGMLLLLPLPLVCSQSVLLIGIVSVAHRVQAERGGNPGT